MSPTTTLLASRWTSLASGFALAALWSMFAALHVAAWRDSGDWTFLVFCASETLAATLFIIRSEASAVSRSPLDWVLAVVSTLAPFLFAPSGSSMGDVGRILVVAAVLAQIAGLLSLNRSFALVAARRVVKTGGMYRLLRHPVYAAYLLSYAGYVIGNPGPRNALVALVGAAMLVARMLREERFLSQDAHYRIYMRQVKYRVLPFVF